MVFLALIQLGQGLFGLPFWNSVLNKGSIANINTLTSVLATPVLFSPLPPCWCLAWLTVRDKPGEELTFHARAGRKPAAKPGRGAAAGQSAVEKWQSRAHSNFVKVVGLFDRYDSETAAT